MAAKTNKKPEKAKVKSIKKEPKMVVISESGVTTKEESFLPMIQEGVAALAPKPLEPSALTPQLVTDSMTLSLRSAQEMCAQLLGTPECAPFLVKVNEWEATIKTIKKLIVGDENKIEGLKKLVIEQGEKWGDNGSKQSTLAGAVVKVKAVNWRAPDAPLTIADLDPELTEAYFRGIMPEPEKSLGYYMKASTVWGLKDLSPLQQKNLTALLADPGVNGQGLRQCVKKTSYQMMAPEMENAS